MANAEPTANCTCNSQVWPKMCAQGRNPITTRLEFNSCCDKDGRCGKEGEEGMGIGEVIRSVRGEREGGWECSVEKGGNEEEVREGKRERKEKNKKCKEEI